MVHIEKMVAVVETDRPRILKKILSKCREELRIHNLLAMF